MHRSGRRPNILLEQWLEPEVGEYDVPLREQAWVEQSVAYARERLGL
ncbi:MAG: hypothetical protein ACYC5O_13865 [Anaerolineae bacterium]